MNQTFNIPTGRLADEDTAVKKRCELREKFCIQENDKIAKRKRILDNGCQQTIEIGRSVNHGVVDKEEIPLVFRDRFSYNRETNNDGDKLDTTAKREELRKRLKYTCGPIEIMKRRELRSDPIDFMSNRSDLREKVRQNPNEVETIVDLSTVRTIDGKIIVLD